MRIVKCDKCGKTGTIVGYKSDGFHELSRVGLSASIDLCSDCYEEFCEVRRQFEHVYDTSVSQWLIENTTSSISIKE